MRFKLLLKSRGATRRANSSRKLLLISGISVFASFAEFRYIKIAFLGIFFGCFGMFHPADSADPERACPS